MTSTIPRVLTVAGSDPSGGAGVQADLKTMGALGAYGMSVVTALTAQSTRGVTGVHAVPVDFVRLQLDTLLADIAPDATKIGMLATAELADAVGEYLPGLPGTVLDPVMVATSGDRLLDADALAALRRLCMRADLITPNLPEAAALLGCEPATSPDEMRRQAEALLARGARRVLLKGGHLAGGAADVYADTDSTVLLPGRRVRTRNTHGTGCTLSSAVAALRPQRDSWIAAVRDAKAYLTGALAHADLLGVGHGHGPVHHYYALWPTQPEGVGRKLKDPTGEPPA
ncbi:MULTISPECIES: bifunctional hydroxymethylpyrimidine kinase/phosphomethylpyrimidine kinase [unclassified Actinomyces]|uniref:bifunctional hydroxymethylpyrimidine kinase/phosphomethylpyrimidine kinase n=1 Tax=unclassified Actinomyces TaxID=2609248 RepID=UPI0013745D03|nr:MULTISPECIES: bifunctional hydroxymethylpyrimidine kinase/phosphomethylpyrimidine kinase [unclassified Actinomyces]NDR54545.1 bifunctional hydroxymethylpyrimidine kinase/phosphomethylpyrimidine kinase [Actinomyces sp. 565]QHO91092.1 bifunctional hydroxymethylpyrimidine kinase/phosphomethylpyrimidine kinase [Actinomyces sp. 432]